MIIDGGLQAGILRRRYKRFLADIERADGSVVTAHCPNTGSMKNCCEPGRRVWFSQSDNRARKYPHTWEIVEVAGGHLVGINTARANGLVAEAVAAGEVPELAGYDRLRREVRYGERGSRIDLLLEAADGRPPCHVEVKNVSLGMAAGRGLFPDAVTARGQKHLEELRAVRLGGARAVLMFCVQHAGIESVAPADEIDPDYGRLLRQAAAAGVELLAWRTRVNLAAGELRLADPLPVRL